MKIFLQCSDSFRFHPTFSKHFLDLLEKWQEKQEGIYSNIINTY